MVYMGAQYGLPSTSCLPSGRALISSSPDLFSSVIVSVAKGREILDKWGKWNEYNVFTAWWLSLDADEAISH